MQSTRCCTRRLRSRPPGDVREDVAEVLAERLALARRAVAHGLEQLVVDVHAVHEQVVQQVLRADVGAMSRRNSRTF